MNQRIESWIVGALTAALAVYWLWLQWPQVALLPGDEPLYLLDAQRWLDGGKLYRDVFLAHPPGRIWQASLLLALGAPAGWAKIWSPLATLATAGLLAWMAPRPPYGAMLASLLFLFANVVLIHGALFVGVEQAMFLATLATLLVLKQRWLWAGVVLGFATQWALHVGILAIPLLVWAWRDKMLRPFALGLALGLVPLVLELLWYGQPMLEQVFGYHLRKVTDMAAQKGADRVWPFLRSHVGLLFLAATGTRRARGRMRWLGYTGLAAFLVLLLWPRLQAYYFLLPMPILAALAGDFWGELVREPRARASSIGQSVLVLLAIAAVGTDYLPARHEERSLDRRGRMSVAATEVTQLSAQVAALSRGQPLWGDGALVPLLSLKTGLPIAAGDTDTNSQRFLSGLTPPGPHLDRVLRDKPLIVLVPKHGIDLVPEIHDRLLRDCDVVGRFDAPAANFAGLLLQPR